MDKIKIVFLIGAALIIAGCTTAESKQKTYEVDRIYTKCSDGVVCYFEKVGYGAGMTCFRDKDLVEKYCSN